MKFLKLIFALIFALLIVGFAYFAVIDVPITQQDVSKEIPNEQFSND